VPRDRVAMRHSDAEVSLFPIRFDFLLYIRWCKLGRDAIRECGSQGSVELMSLLLGLRRRLLSLGPYHDVEEPNPS
jgi:hypothetical protein